MSEVRRVPLAAITVDPAVQQRVNGTSEEVVGEYAQAMRAGDKFPPVDVFSNGDGTFQVADGFHRLEAYRRNQAGEQEIECKVYHGDRDDAILFACGANAGLRRSPSDQRKAVLSLLGNATWSQWSDREIARRCKVSPTLVARVRKEHLQTASIDGGRKGERAEDTASAPDRAATVAPATDRRRTVMRGGKSYRMRTAQIGGGRAAARSRNKAEPRSGLDSLAWATATSQERVAFVKGVGRRGIEDAFNAIEPNELTLGFDTLNRAWKAAKEHERQAFAKEHYAEINSLAKEPGPAIAVEPTPDPTPADRLHELKRDDDSLAIPTFLRRVKAPSPDPASDEVGDTALSDIASPGSASGAASGRTPTPQR